MNERFIVNIIHRPEMVPEYAEKVTGHGKQEDLGRKALLTESLDIFKTQQQLAHKYGLKTTIQMTYASLFNPEAVELAKEHHRVYGDEKVNELFPVSCPSITVNRIVFETGLNNQLTYLNRKVIESRDIALPELRMRRRKE